MNGNGLSQEVLSTLRQIIRAIDLHSKQLSKNYGLTGPQLLLIREIASEPDISVGKLAKRVSLSQATVTSIVDRLEARDLARRIRSSTDKRKVALEVTEKARDILRENPTFLQEQFISNFERLEKWEQLLILSSLQRVATMMNAEEFTPSPVLSREPFPDEHPQPASRPQAEER
ncbi:MAG: MarR family winged helix-turn-helix transcriptional regulator [Spirochaetaceae bacterium]